MIPEWSIGQAKRWRLVPGLRLRINGTFKRLRYKSSGKFFTVPLEPSMPPADLAAGRRAVAADGRRRLFRIVLFCIGCIGGMSALLALKPRAGAAEGHTLIIPPNDGYGFEECLTPGSQCGLVVADAWCKAHGFAGSQGFGPETSGTADAPSGAIRVICTGAIN